MKVSSAYDSIDHFRLAHLGMCLKTCTLFFYKHCNFLAEAHLLLKYHEKEAQNLLNSPVEYGGQWSDLLEINHSRLFGTLIGCIL